MSLSYEQGPIRPPSEARSLLIRATRNCPWNKCAFCHSYRDAKFELRTVPEIKEDVHTAREIADAIKALSRKIGAGGRVTDAVLQAIYDGDDFYDDSYKSVGAWLYFGGESVFLQDANTIIMKTADLVEVLSFIKEQFPQVTRITSYCRSHTAARKSVEELKSLRKAGLSRIHIGMESGSDPVLDFIRKGTTAADHIEGGKRIVAAGISLSEYVIPGLGGTRWTKEHAVETARVINQINPQYVRLRSLHAVRGTKLYDMIKSGEFEPLRDEDVLQEIRLFIENLDGIETTIVSDHILNLLEELEGKLPEAKPKLLATIDRFFALPEKERLIFRLGRRRGIYRRLDDLSDRFTHKRLETVVDQYAAQDAGQMDKELAKIMNGYI
jgi:radical SAM superfamily enzyme YgiQ (UPF0313 family)